MITEREKLEFESLPEFVREPKPARDTYSSRVAAPAFEPAAEPAAVSGLPKTAELEALWPGVSQDVFHAAAPKKGRGFFLAVGFAAGIVVAFVGSWAVSAVSHLAANQPQDKEIVVAQTSKAHATESGATSASAGSDPATIVPLAPVYAVASGDTLAGIALKNYHRATPRLLDEICKANNMQNANVLNLGQKLNLPEYHPQPRQIATGANQVQQ